MGHRQNQDHHHHHRRLASFGRKESSSVGPAAPPPKGCMAIRVGQEGEEQQRFVVPVMYLSHPLFAGLLKEAEEEYGFHHSGAITIPCHVEYFRQVQDTIEKTRGAPHHHHGGHTGSSSNNHHHHYFHLTSCFGGLKA